MQVMMRLFKCDSIMSSLAPIDIVERLGISTNTWERILGDDRRGATTINSSFRGRSAATKSLCSKWWQKG
jgi:hypothetical protein